MTDNRLTLKDMCTEFDVTLRTLRYYEYMSFSNPIAKVGRGFTARGNAH